jgi:RNA polymerase sigma factor (TIGR02999 family)
MAGFRNGHKDSADRLMEALYPELRRLAAVRMRRERAGHSWQPTELVNELYLELARQKTLGSADPEERDAFMGLAGFLMWRLLILHSRPLRKHVETTGAEVLDRQAAQEPTADKLQIVEELLSRLEAIDPRIRTVVELRVFEGTTTEEIAERLGCSPRSVGTYWAFARDWLQAEMSPAG